MKIVVAEDLTLLRDGLILMLVDAVRRVAAGGTALDPTVVAKLLGSHERLLPLNQLTAREREMLAEMAQGRSATAAVTFTDLPGELRVTVDDDGTGGVDPARGSGLRGIIDRLDAVDGGLTVDSPAGGPTRVTIVLPVPAPGIGSRDVSSSAGRRGGDRDGGAPPTT